MTSAIDRLAPQRGTSLAGGILASLKVIAVEEAGYAGNDFYTNRSAAPSPTDTPTPMPSGTHAPAAIVLLSDGENNENPDPIAAAQAAADVGVRIYTIGVGSAAGANVLVSGVQIHTQLDAATLQKISLVTDGTYYSAADTDQLRAVYDNLDLGLVLAPQLTEITALFAAASLLLLLVGAMGSMAWLGRLQ